MQIYILDKDPKRAAHLLRDWPARVRCTNLREGQQILSVALAQRGLPTLRKKDGGRYGAHNHEYHRLTRFFCGRASRVAWLFDHVAAVTFLYYPDHFGRLMQWAKEDRGEFCFARAHLDEIPWFPMKGYDGPVQDFEAYLVWKYRNKNAGRE